MTKAIKKGKQCPGGYWIPKDRQCGDAQKTLTKARKKMVSARKKWSEVKSRFAKIGKKGSFVDKKDLQAAISTGAAGVALSSAIALGGQGRQPSEERS